jgi:hypothetical protein
MQNIIVLYMIIHLNGICCDLRASHVNHHSFIGILAWSFVCVCFVLELVLRMTINQA